MSEFYLWLKNLWHHDFCPFSQDSNDKKADRIKTNIFQVNSNLCFHVNGVVRVSDRLFMKTLPTFHGKSNMAVPWQFEVSKADMAWCKGLKTFGWRTWEEVKRWPESIRWASACATGTRGPMWDGAGRTVPSNPVRSSKQDTWRQKRHRWRWGAHLGDPITAECVNRLCAVIHSCSDKTVKMKSQPDQKICTCKPRSLPTSGM